MKNKKKSKVIKIITNFKEGIYIPEIIFIRIVNGKERIKKYNSYSFGTIGLILYLEKKYPKLFEEIR